MRCKARQSQITTPLSHISPITGLETNINQYYSFKIFLRFWLVKNNTHNSPQPAAVGQILNQWCQKCSPLKIIEPMMSKWRQKCSPLQIIELLTRKTWGQSCVILVRGKTERNGETPSWTGKYMYFEWIIKQLLNSAFVGYEEFCRSQRVLHVSPCCVTRPLASVDNTLLDLQNFLYSIQPHSKIA